MNEYRVSILPRAVEDIERNANWWAENHDVAQASHWFEAVKEQILSLNQSPESHGLSSENDDFPYEIRDKLLGVGSHPTHRAVFTIREKTVFVIAVLGSAQRDLSPSDVEF